MWPTRLDIRIPELIEPEEGLDAENLDPERFPAPPDTASDDDAELSVEG